MSHSTLEYSELLREAIKLATANAPKAIDDLRRCASQAAAAIAEVTSGQASLELIPINEGEKAQSAYQLQLRKVGSESPPSDLGVYSISAAGYPVLRWYSRNGWEINRDKPSGEYLKPEDLESHFRWLVSKPESRLVVLVTFFQQQAFDRSNAGN